MFRPRLQTARWTLLLGLIVLLFYWKIAFTKQFTILSEWELVSQHYTWYTYAAAWIQKGIVPLWDPFRYGGISFPGEMLAGLFYPLKLALYLAPFEPSGLLSERAFNLFYIFGHWLAALFMFILARYLGLGHLPALVAGICFGLGGFMQWTAWMNYLDAMAWLPLIVLFMLRAFDSGGTRKRLANAGMAGLALGMTVLAGGLHIALMDAIVAATLTACMWFYSRGKPSILSAGIVLGAVAFTSILFAAVQLLPSLEYAPLAYRWVGGEAPIRPLEKIPYSLLVPWSFGPQSLFGFVLGEVDAGRSDWTPYFGVLPLVLVIIGVWKYWSNPLIRYLSVLAALAFVYSWGSLSFLHGVLYLVPYLDIAREADRFIYLTHFAMAILAGFGVQYLFKDRKPGEGFSLSPLISVLKWVTAGFAALLAAASLGLPVGVTEKTYLSFFFIAAALALLLFLRGGRTAQGVSFVLVFLIVWDLYAFNRMIQSKVERRKVNGDALAHLVYDRKLADFVKSQPGMPRVHFDIPEGAPNIGNAYGVPVTWAMSASMLMDYTAGIGYGRQRDLLSVKYTIRHRDEKSGNTPVYRDDMWDVFENPNALPRAWIVHRADVDSSTERPLQQVIDPSFDLTRTVILDRPLESPLVNDVAGTGNTVKWLTYQPNRLELEVHAEAAGVLVLSEVYYPGWTASVDGERAEIYRANGLLRAIPIQEGTHRVVVRYLPNSVRWGAALTVLTFLGVCILLRLANKS